MVSSVTMTNNNSIKKRPVINTTKTISFKNQNDSFVSTKQNKQQNISFAGKLYPSGYYDDYDVKKAKKYLNESGDKWEEEVFQEKFNILKSMNIPLHNNNSQERVIIGFLTAGMSEAHYAIKSKQCSDEAKSYLHKIRTLRSDMINERLDEQSEAAEIAKQDALIKKEYLQKMSNVKETQLKTKLIDQIQRVKEGKSASVPNCVMLVGGDKITDELIKWTGENTNCNFVQIGKDDNILKYLKNGEQHYREKGERTLLHVRNFNQLINPKKTPEHVIGDLKDLMSSASEDFHSTIIFSTGGISELDSIAIQPHRVERIDANFSTPESESAHAAWHRLESNWPGSNSRANMTRGTFRPIATINDFITYGGNEIEKLGIDHSQEELARIEKKLRDSKIAYSYGLNAVFEDAIKKLKF